MTKTEFIEILKSAKEKAVTKRTERKESMKRLRESNKKSIKEDNTSE